MSVKISRRGFQPRIFLLWANSFVLICVPFLVLILKKYYVIRQSVISRRENKNLIHRAKNFRTRCLKTMSGWNNQFLDGTVPKPRKWTFLSAVVLVVVCKLNFSLTHKTEDIKQDRNSMVNIKTSVVEKLSVVMHITEGLSSKVTIGNSIVGIELFLVSSMENVRSSEDTTFMIRLTPTSSFIDLVSSTSRFCFLTRFSSLLEFP